MGKKEKTSEETERDEKVRTTRIKVQSFTEYDRKIRNAHIEYIYINHEFPVFSNYILKNTNSPYFTPKLNHRDFHSRLVDFYIFTENKVCVHARHEKKKKVYTKYSKYSGTLFHV